MPDTGLNLANLREHFRRHIAVYLAGIAAMAALTGLLWTATAPRIPSSRSVLIYLVDTYADPAPLDDIAADMLARTRAFDDTLESVEFQGLMYTDPSVNYAGEMLLMTRLSLGEADAFLCCEGAMNRLVSAGAALPLDDYAAAGWLDEYGLEPWYATVEYEETGEKRTLLAGYRLDGVDALRALGAFENKGAYLAVAAASDNRDTAVRAVEVMLEDLLAQPEQEDANA